MQDKLRAEEKVALYIADTHNSFLTKKQLRERLPTDAVRVKIDKSEEQLLSRLISEEKYERDFLPVYRDKMERAKYFVERVIKKIGWVEGVWVTGSVAAGYPREEDDIDILMVCRKNTVWICRIFIYILAFFAKINIRKTGERKYKDVFCLNMWLDRSNLAILPEKRNARNALDFVLAKKIWGEEVIESGLVAENQWVTKYYSLSTKFIHSRSVRKVKKNSWNRWLGAANRLFYFVQKLRMNSKIKKEKVACGYAYFHPKG